MKKILYILLVIAYLLFVYFIMNYVLWNNTIYGIGGILKLFFALVFAFLATIAVAFKIKNKTITLLTCVIIFLFSYYSLKVGQKQAIHCIFKVKIAVDKYYTKYKKYPKKLSELEKQGFIRRITRPMFLIPNGRYHLYISKDSDTYTLNLGVNHANCGVSIQNNIDNFPYYWYDN